MTNQTDVAIIVGAGSGISASLARKFAADGIKVALVARNVEKLAPLCNETGAISIRADATVAEQISGVFHRVSDELGIPTIAVYNASARLGGSLLDIDPLGVRAAIDVSVFGAFLVVQQAAKRMVSNGRGSILLTGATASIKGFAGSAAFAMGKFALRGLAQSAARELGPRGIHVAHFVIDGGVRAIGRDDQDDTMLDPDDIAQTYLNVARQNRSAWSQEVELRPWAERF